MTDRETLGEWYWKEGDPLLRKENVKALCNLTDIQVANRLKHKRKLCSEHGVLTEPRA